MGSLSNIAARLQGKPSLLWSAFVAFATLAFLAGIAYLRDANVAGSSQTYLYLEVGGTLLSLCYAANALIRFRGTHDRTALIFSFGFVLSALIETDIARTSSTSLRRMICSLPSACRRVRLVGDSATSRPLNT